jgi:hypothetical protein
MRIPFISLFCIGSIKSTFLENVSPSKSFILNYNLKSCKNCVHFQPSTYNEFDSYLAKCTLFGKKDIITNEINYDFADSCRIDESKCGMHAKYFEEEPNLDLKITKHQLMKNAPFIILISFLIIEIITLSYKLTHT